MINFIHFKDCNNQSSVHIHTLSVIWSTGNGRHLQCSQAFTFSLVNPSGLGPTKMSLITGNENSAIYCSDNGGPSFGGGCDLFISDRANTDNRTYSNLGNTYQRPPGQQNTFFTGSKNFNVTDYEVFGLQQWPSQCKEMVLQWNNKVIHW